MTVGQASLKNPKIAPHGRKVSITHLEGPENLSKDFHAQLSGPPFPTASTWEERRRGPGRVFLQNHWPLFPNSNRRPTSVDLAGTPLSSRRNHMLTSLGAASPSALLTGAPSPQAAPSTRLLLLLPVTSCPVTCRACQRLWEGSFYETPLNFPAFESHLLPIGPELTEKRKRKKPATPHTLFPPAAGRDRTGGDFIGWVSKL